MTEKLLVDLREAAAALSLSERMVRYLIARGELAPVIRVGRSARIPITTLRSFVEERAAGIPAPRSA